MLSALLQDAMRITHWFLLAGLLGLSSVVHAQDTDETKRLITEGQRYFEAGDCKKAYPILQEAYARSNQPGLLTSIAQCAEFLKDNPEALAAYCAYQTIDPNSAYKDTINQSIQELRKSTKSECPTESKYLPKPKKEEPTPIPAPLPEKPKKLLVPVSLAALGAVLGSATLGIRVQAKQKNELPQAKKTLGLLLAIGADLSFIAAGATLYVALKAPDKEPSASQPQETSLLVSLQLPLP